jgi:hypothetical protein
MRILYFLSAVVLAVVLIVGCTDEPKGVVDPVNPTGLVPPPIDPCDPNLCLNCGECVDNGDGTFSCVCPTGVTGKYCEIDPCKFSPCAVGEVCVRGDNGLSYTCVTPTGVDDDDGDSVPNADDQCPNTPSGAAVNSLGCAKDQCVTPPADSDGDGVDDDADQCAGTASGDVVDATGCSIAQYCPCDNNWKNHGKYVSCVAHNAEDFVDAGLITEAEKDAIVSAAGQSNCGKKK